VVCSPRYSAAVDEGDAILQFGNLEREFPPDMIRWDSIVNEKAPAMGSIAGAFSWVSRGDWI